MKQWLVLFGRGKPYLGAALSVSVSVCQSGKLWQMVVMHCQGRLGMVMQPGPKGSAMASSGPRIIIME